MSHPPEVRSFLKKIFVEGHGCSASFADTEIISGMVANAGYEIVQDHDEADLSILVTCSVKDVTEKRMLSRIQELSAGGRNKLIVAGCLAKAEPKKIHDINPGLSLLGPENLDRIIPVVEGTFRGEKIVEVSERKIAKVGLPRSRINKTIGIVEISSGCLSSCTFCQVKLVKGIVFSYPEQEIVKEARTLVREGVREIWLTSTDNAAYGRDSRTSLPRLVKSVSSIQGDFKIRIGMMNPLLTGRILDELIECYSDPKVFKFLHLPVQSGSDRILELMQRGYDVQTFLATVESFRKAVPRLTLSTDIIVGFPSEEESDFEATVELIRRVRPDIVNLSRYGMRSGTKAAQMSDQIPAEVSKDRSRRLSRLIHDISYDKNREWVGWSGPALVDEVVKDAYVARNFAYKPCLIRGDGPAEAWLGKEVCVSVLDATSSTLRATVK